MRMLRALSLVTLSHIEACSTMMGALSSMLNWGMGKNLWLLKGSST